MAKAKKTPVETPVDEFKDIKRKVHYHELRFEFNEAIDNSKAINKDPFNAFFSMIAKMASDKDGTRYQEVMDAKVFMQDIIFDKDGSTISGKLRYVKMDVFPQLIDVVTDEITNIEARENQGIVETTHFIIGISKTVKYLALEYNHDGAKIAEFLSYCEKIGTVKGVINNVNFTTLVRDEISTFENRMGFITAFSMRVHKNYIPQIESISPDAVTGLKMIESQFDAEYVEVNMRFKAKKKVKSQNVEQPITQPIVEVFTKLRDAIIKDKNKTNLFDKLEAKARDYEKNLRVSLFDLLADKVTSEINVQKKPKQRVILSDDMFSKMKIEYINKNL